MCFSSYCLQHNADELHLSMDDIQADILRSNQLNISCGELINLKIEREKARLCFFFYHYLN